MKLRKHERIDVDEAERRALECLARDGVCRSSWVANNIWPDHSMTAQGAGAAASRILKRLEKAGKVRWTPVRNSGWGWKLAASRAPDSAPDEVPR